MVARLQRSPAWWPISAAMLCGLIVGGPILVHQARAEMIARAHPAQTEQAAGRDRAGAGVGAPRPNATPPSADFQSDAAEKRRANAWTVGLASGLLEGTYIRFAAELAVVLNKEDDLRVLPVITPGAIQNVKDLLYLRGIDIMITQADVLEYFTKVEPIPKLANRISYITRLYHSEVHVFARQEFRTLQDLAGRRVNLHQPGTAPTLTGRIVFDRLGIPIEASYLNNAVAIEKMKTGEIDALVQVTSKPNDLFNKFKGEGFHFIPIPFSDKFADFYLPTELATADYPSLIKGDEKVDTLAVATVLAAYDWPENSDRFLRVSRFVDRLFEKFPELQKPPFHVKWKDVNLATTIPGWRRHQAVDRILTAWAANETNGARAQFNDFMRQRSSSAVDNTPEGREALFRNFMEWRARGGSLTLQQR